MHKFFVILSWTELFKNPVMIYAGHCEVTPSCVIVKATPLVWVCMFIFSATEIQIYSLPFS